MKQYKEVGVLGLPMKVSLEKGALVSVSVSSLCGVSS